LIAAKFSHDMKWVLYSSDQSGAMQVYVRPLNSSQSGMWQVSSNGGTQGWWVNNDKAIIYVTADGKVFKVSANGSGNSFAVGSSQYLFSLSDRNLSGLSDVSRDGREFLGTRPVGRATIPPLTYVQNWKGLIGGRGN
jgi:Tol biopolymer transport system component